MAQLKITLVKSVIGSSERQRNVVKALGLKKTNSSVVQDDTAVIRGEYYTLDEKLTGTEGEEDGQITTEN